MDDLKLMRNFIHGARKKCHSIGIGLNISSHMLESIGGQEENCFMEMLTVWLKTDNPPPTWTALNKAIDQAGISETEKIRLLLN